MHSRAHRNDIRCVIPKNLQVKRAIRMTSPPNRRRTLRMRHHGDLIRHHETTKQPDAKLPQATFPLQTEFIAFRRPPHRRQQFPRLLRGQARTIINQ